MELRQTIQIIKSRKLVFISAFALMTATALGISVILPNKYTATGALVFDIKTPDPINGMVFSGLPSSYLATQADILTSERVAKKVISNLRLDKSEVLLNQWKDESSIDGSFGNWVETTMGRFLTAKPAKDSSVIEVSYTATDPKFAQVMANAYIQAFIEATLELRTEPAKRYKQLFEQQAELASTKLAQAQNALSEYQRSKGITASDERIDIETARLNELSSQLVGIQAVVAESTSKSKRVTPNSPEVILNPLIGSLKADLSRQESRLKELTARYGSSHPSVRELEANIAEMQSSVREETSRVISSMSVTDSVNTMRQAQVADALEKQRHKILQLKEQRDQASVLQQSVGNAQRAYDMVMAKLSQSALESQNSQTNVAVLHEAPLPFKASSPRLVLNTIAGMFGGIFLGTFLCVWRESTDRRYRSALDLQGIIGNAAWVQIPRATQTKPAKTFLASTLRLRTGNQTKAILLDAKTK